MFRVVIFGGGCGKGGVAVCLGLFAQAWEGFGIWVNLWSVYIYLVFRAAQNKIGMAIWLVRFGPLVGLLLYKTSPIHYNSTYCRQVRRDFDGEDPYLATTMHKTCRRGPQEPVSKRKGATLAGCCFTSPS